MNKRMKEFLENNPVRAKAFRAILALVADGEVHTLEECSRVAGGNAIYDLESLERLGYVKKARVSGAIAVVTT